MRISTSNAAYKTGNQVKVLGRTAYAPESLSDMADETLVNMFVKRGDENAFNELVNRYTDKVYRLAYRISRDQGSAEEILQEVFITLVEKLDTFREEAKFSTWLYRVASNASYLFLRKGSKVRDREYSLDDYKPYNDSGYLEGVEESDWSRAPDDILLGNEGAGILEKAINELPEDYRIVFQMKDVEGLTSKEIGEILKLSVPAVKSRVLRARLFLRDKLSEYYHEFKQD